MDESVSTFAAITGASTDVAQGFLQITNGDVERAIELFFENPDLASGLGAAAPTEPSVAPPPRSNIGQEDSSGVIHIPSDDDDDDNTMQLDDDGDHDDSENEHAAAVLAAATAQEEEDAAMAKRLQEELYSEGGGSGAHGGGLGEEDVRAPIARTTETLVAPTAGGWGGDDDMGSAILNQLRRNRRPPPSSGTGPFSHRIWADGADTRSTTENGSHARRLEDLFRPPYDIMARISWDEARTLGKEDKKWILVNLQDMSDFNCQALNRDIWKDQAVRDLVSENFIFLQYDKDNPYSEEFITFYFPNQTHENPDNYPHVSIIDPRTGEQVKVWSGRPFPKAIEFHAELAEFLDRYSLAANSKNPVAKAATKKPQTVDVDRMTEEEMLEMALKNSLAAGSSSGAAGESSGSTSTPNIHDPDALTKTPPAGSQAEPEQSEAQKAFKQISSTNTHTEPENNPATTTRIQLRHPNGRVIRRFNLQDPVRRIYEWLKAEPLEGKEGVDFELKKMPQGQDLVESLDATIEESGLKQGTIMLELLEE